MKITTESGAEYTVRGGIWQKNNGYAQKVWEMHCIHNEDLIRWFERESYEKLEVQVGKKLYITGKDEWWLSTPIVSIEMEEGDE
jgi:hypothetical protein